MHRFIWPGVLLAAAASTACTDLRPAPAGLAAAALRHSDFRWMRHNTPTLRFYYQADSFAAARIDSLAAAAEAARRLDLAYLGAREFGLPIDVFYLDSRAQMQALVGQPVTGFADRSARAVFLVVNRSWRAFDRHELMHVLSAHLWGPPADSADWLVEGLATFADGRCGGYPLDTLLAERARTGDLVPFDMVVARFRQLDDLTAYLQAGSMVGHLYRSHGRDAVRDLWENGVARAPEVLGRPVAKLEREWRAALAATPGLPPAVLERVWSYGCG